MHDLLYRLARPALYLLDPEQAHRLAIAALETISLLQRIYDTAAVLHGSAPGPRSPG